MALLTRNRPAGSVAAVRDRAVRTAQRAVPAAKDVSTAVAPQYRWKSAGDAVRHSAEDVAAWARPTWTRRPPGRSPGWTTPGRGRRRSWSAPGSRSQETIAPAIADAMVSAAHAIDVKPDPPRRSPGWPPSDDGRRGRQRGGRGDAAAQAGRVRLRPGRGHRAGRRAGGDRHADPRRGQRQPARQRSSDESPRPDPPSPT